MLEQLDIDINFDRENNKKPLKPRKKNEEIKEIKKYANFSLSSSSLTTIALNLYISNSIPFLPTISNKRINSFSIYPFIFIFYFIYIFYQ